MIFIVTSDNDFSSHLVIDWLKHLNKDFVLITDSSIIELESLHISNDSVSLKIIINGRRINCDEICSYWYRRGGINFINIKDFIEYNDNKMMIHHLQAENKDLEQFVNYLLLSVSKKHIGDLEIHKLNKLHVLLMAKRVGLTIPNTFLTQSKSNIEEYLCSISNTGVTKSISEGPIFNIGDIKLSNKTLLIQNQFISEAFPPSLIQENVSKIFEIRSFFLNNKFFSTAIFSQSNSLTETDFRNYDERKPNRCVPFKLPRLIETKLSKLMHILSLNTGSIDLIVNNKNEYVFLEINPIGIFNYYSNTCNYNLEKVIAESL